MASTLDDDAAREAIRAMYLEGERPAPSITAHELRMKVSRSRMRIGFKAPVALAATVLLVVVLFTATPLRHRGQSIVQRNIPAGWTAHSAYGVQISVPRSWKVSYFPTCAEGGHPGELDLGTSQGATCQSFPGGTGGTMVVVTKVRLTGPSVPRSGFSNFKKISVNGLVVLAKSSAGSFDWYIESAQVSIFGYGPGAARVLHTVSRSTSHAIPAPGIGKGTTYLDALSRVPRSGPVQVRSVDTGKTTTVQAAIGQFSFQGPPGRYVVTTDAGSAPCAPIQVSLTSGTYSTWPPLVCQGE